MAKDFKNYASQVLAHIYEHNDFERIHTLLRQRDRKFEGVSPDVFGTEYLAGRLALACKLWERACDENRINSEETRKALLRRVMQGFESQKFLPLAAAFSEYFQEPAVEENPLLGTVEKLFNRLSINSRTNRSSGPAPAETFETMMAVSESFKTSFENDFFEFVHL